MFPAVDTADVQALTACIDWVIERTERAHERPCPRFSSRRRSAIPGSTAARALDVDLGIDWSDEELAERIGDYDGIVIRSATKMTAELIGQPAGCA